MASTRYERRGSTALVTMDAPPVNALGAGLRAGLAAALDRALSDEAVRAVVVTGGPRAFSAGADITEFATPAMSAPPRLHDLIGRIEAAPKPVIAAIAGACLGGGLELALAAHARVARADARIGLPEVTLGLLPGAGGTQRLPRLVGLRRALEMVTSGRAVPASSLAGTALLDGITDGDVVEAALELAEAGVALQRVRDLPVVEPDADAVLAEARRTAAAARGQVAPPACVEAVARSVTEPFEEGLRHEGETFLELLASPQSRALRHAFAAERAASTVAGPTARPRRVDRIGVVGAGTMGGGIAMAFADAGVPVVLCEATRGALDRGLAVVRGNYERSRRRGRLTAQQVEERTGLITPTLDLADLGDADLVIEAVFEELAVKEEVFRALDSACRPGAVLATNTSYLDVDRIAAVTRRPQDVLGLHFFSPANVMRLLEVVRAARTAPDVLATALAVARRLGKIPVVAGVCDGFIGNRMITRYVAAAQHLVDVGASPQEVDAALEGFGMAIGPFRMADLAGLDIGWATRRRHAAEAGVPLRRAVVDALCEAGRFGQKSGAGWYRYEPGSRVPQPDAVTDALIAGHRAAEGITPRPVGEGEIVQRCVYALVNEGARLLEEGIAARASDVDVVYLHGYGFPRWRGGPMFHASQVGLPAVAQALERMAAEPGADPSWEPAPLLRRLAEQGGTFG